jgi:predicted RNA-binding protein (virulence factor B family)
MPNPEPSQPIEVGDVAYLKIVSVKEAGAFLAWGKPKDLLLPWSEVKFEQKRRIAEGRKILVCVFEAEDGRVAASARLDDFLRDEAEGYRQGDKVTILVDEPTDLGLRVVVDNRYWGLVHKSDLFGTLPRGHRQDGYVKAPRADGKLDIALAAPGYAKVESAAEKVLAVLAKRGGTLPVGDKTPPEEIYALFGISKKAFKQTLGALYRERKIVLEEGGIRLV